MNGDKVTKVVCINFKCGMFSHFSLATVGMQGVAYRNLAPIKTIHNIKPNKFYPLRKNLSAKLEWVGAEDTYDGSPGYRMVVMYNGKEKFSDIERFDDQNTVEVSLR